MPKRSFPICPSFPSRKPLVFLSMMGLLMAGVTAAAFAQAPSKKAVIKTDTLRTSDGWTIPITYYQSPLGKEAAVVILLHGTGENQLIWKQKTGLAARLHAENFAVISCDLRKHGESKNARDSGNKKLDANDYKAMAFPGNASELEVIQEFLFEEHQAGRLNMAKLGILAMDDMVPVALMWAFGDWLKKPYQDAPTLATMTPRGQTVRAIAMVSPTESVAGLSSNRALQFFRNKGTLVSFLFMNGEKDGSARDMKDMVKLVSTPKNKSVVFEQSFPTQLKGADLLARTPNAEKLIVGFFKKQLQDLKVEWQDRRSRLER